MKVLSDVAAERGVLAGICQYGSEAYLDVCDILKEKTFTDQYNEIIFACIKRIYSQDDNSIIDVASLYSAGEELGLSSIMSKQEVLEHINSLFNFPVEKSNVRKLASKIRKLEITRLLRNQLKGASDKLSELDGNESITHILGIAENSVFDFASVLEDQDNQPKNIGDGLEEYIQHLADNPIDQIGIPTGFSEYDKAIGGGLRKGTINVVAARSKCGKSILTGCIGYHIASKHQIPVLVMDTEMTYEDHLHRLLAMASDCFIYDIETGKFAKKPDVNKRVRTIAKQIAQKQIPYEHKSIAGMPFEEQLSIMRRWLVKRVGLDSQGYAKPCVIIYDYLKLMTSESINKNLAEYQALGFMMSSLHNFTVRYKVPIFATLQTNRDGVGKEDVTVASGSDRIVWLCSNFTLFKIKSDEEIAQDGVDKGNRKLVPVVCRHGEGIEFGNYINCYMNGAKAQIVEGKTKFQLLQESKNESDNSE